MLHRFRSGDAGIGANLDDYAFLIWGLIELYETTFNVKLLETALELNRDLLEHFWDSHEDGFFFSADDSEELLVRYKDVLDGAVPSGNSVAMMNLLRLARMTADPDLEAKANLIKQSFTANIKRSPAAHTHFLSALQFALGPTFEVVIAGDIETEDTQAMLKALHKQYLPNKIVLFRPDEGESADILNLAEFTKSQHSLDGKATAYVCQNYRCNLPTTDINEMLKLLK